LSTVATVPHVWNRVSLVAGGVAIIFGLQFIFFSVRLFEIFFIFIF
jgi:hypothetical protein